MGAENLPVNTQFQKTSRGWTWRFNWGYWGSKSRHYDSGREPTLEQAIKSALASWNGREA